MECFDSLYDFKGAESKYIWYFPPTRKVTLQSMEICIQKPNNDNNGYTSKRLACVMK